MKLRIPTKVFYKISWKKYIENLYQPPPPPPPASLPQIRDSRERNMARFGFRAASSLISGGWMFAVQFYSIQE